ncbi:unnamed protein product [Didymodactylos carnosus]|uniref:Uncharacterized protein n=1 Tax=Didymodactylos carnosus TaxID=1234261 RepID=A0A816DN45_9BILA|nr:unnamed protein product [Didymodactylos carnosus]CAF4541716.1 unnamed protein product [Didymodactylos carnosus]
MLYAACRNNDIKKVKQLLKTLRVDEVNRTETNSSTALHAAAYYGHAEIVKLLLDSGASRSIKNRFQLTPYEEASTPEIKQLFERRSDSVRFVSLSSEIEWLFIDPNVIGKSADYRKRLKRLSNNLAHSCQLITECYLDIELRDITGIDIIKWYFYRAAQEDNPMYIVKAYTAETEFYARLNKDLAATSEDILNVKLISFNNSFQKYWYTNGRIAGIIAEHPKLKSYTFIGKTYRGMRLTDYDLLHYITGTRVMNKSFLSTTKDKEIASKFAEKMSLMESTNKKYPTLCRYEIINNRTALDIEQ